MLYFGSERLLGAVLQANSVRTTGLRLASVFAKQGLELVHSREETSGHSCHMCTCTPNTGAFTQRHSKAAFGKDA